MDPNGGLDFKPKLGKWKNTVRRVFQGFCPGDGLWVELRAEERPQRVRAAEARVGVIIDVIEQLRDGGVVVGEFGSVDRVSVVHRRQEHQVAAVAWKQ